MSTAVVEFTRRWRNSPESTSKENMLEISCEYADDLLGMGYSQEWVERVVDKVLKGYERVLHKVHQGETTRNRT